MNEAIKISNLSKSYGTHVVLNGLDFCVQQGEIFALLGVNGAGKTTSLECIEGLRKYDSGSITINGIMGIQLQSASLPEHIKPLEAVRLFAKWNKTSLDKETLEALGIYDFAKKKKKTVLSIINRAKAATSFSACFNTKPGYFVS